MYEEDCRRIKSFDVQLAQSRGSDASHILEELYDTKHIARGQCYFLLDYVQILAKMEYAWYARWKVFYDAYPQLEEECAEVVRRPFPGQMYVDEFPSARYRELIAAVNQVMDQIPLESETTKDIPGSLDEKSPATGGTRPLVYDDKQASLADDIPVCQPMLGKPQGDEDRPTLPISVDCRRVE